MDDGSQEKGLDVTQALGDIRRQLPQALGYLLRFLYKPLGTIRKTPPWGLPTGVILLIIITFLSAVASVFVNFRFTGLVMAFFFPFAKILAHLVESVVVYYIVILLFRRKPSFTRIFNVLLVASVYFYILYVVSRVVPAAEVVGYLSMAVFLIYGLSFQLDLSFPKVAFLVSAVFVLIVGKWGFDFYKDWMNSQRGSENKISDRAIEIFEKRVSKRNPASCRFRIRRI